MARVMLLSLVFPPDNVSTAHIMGALATDLKQRGHEVVVLTTLPHYNRDPYAEARQPIAPRWGRLVQKSAYDGIPVYHVYMPRKGQNDLRRVAAWLGFHVISTIAGAAMLPRPDVIVAPSPPLTIGVVAWLLGALYRAPYVYNAQELYPDYAIDLGALRNAWLIRLLRLVESLVYRTAAAVTVIAPRMRRKLLERGVPAGKVVLIPNFVDLDSLGPTPKDNPFSRQYHLADSLVVSYAGNVGPSQDLETFVYAAAECQADRRIRFAIIGDGAAKGQLKQLAAALHVTNLVFVDHQPYSIVPQIYGASDLCLVPQKSGVCSDGLPSKVYRIMACSRPILAATPAESDLARLVEEASCGVVVPPSSPSVMANAIRSAFRDQARLAEMGRAGRAHVISHYSRPAITRQYDALIRRIVSEGRLHGHDA